MITPLDAPDGGPVLVWFHGGGWTIGSATDASATCRDLAAQAGCVVVNVDYRLAPEHPFPQPLDDAVAVYRWCLDHAEEIGGDASRIAVGGDSAGGYLATALCLDSKRLGIPQPLHQLLIYPDVDMANRSESMVTIDAFVNLAMILSLIHISEPTRPY